MDVVVTHADAHRISGNDHALNNDVRVVHQNIAVFASPWLTLIGVAHEVLLARKLARHKAPLQARGKAGATPTAQARLFHRGDDLVLRQGFRALSLLLAEHFAQSLVATTRFVVAQSPVRTVKSGVNLRLNVSAMKTRL